MSKRIIESMRNFKYFKKLHNTRKKSISKFFSSFFLTKKPGLEEEEEKKPSVNFIFKFSDYKSLNLETSEDIFIKELKKTEKNDEIKIKPNFNTFYSNKENNKRNLNVMMNILYRSKKCRRYFKYNDLNENLIKLLLSYSVHEYYKKDSIVFMSGSKQSAFYFLIRGKISLKSSYHEYIRREVNRNQYKIETLYNNIKAEEKFNLLNFSNDNISLDKFVSKIEPFHISKFGSGHHSKTEDNLLPKSISSKGVNKNVRRSLNRLTTVKLEAFMSKHLVQDKILSEDYRKLLKDLSSTLKTYSKGDFFCDWEIILDKPHLETAYAEEDTDLLILPRKYFEKYFSRHYIRTDNERKLFLTKRIEFLHINNVVNLKPEFYDKYNVIYTKFDYANEFFVIYKGKGALMDFNYDYSYKKKSDIIYNASDLKILCYVGEGCVVGLESFHDCDKKYEYNFVIQEDNTIIYRIKMNRINEDNYLKKKNKNKLKKQLNEMYLSQNQFLPKIADNKKLTNEEKKIKKKEEKLNHVFSDSKTYFWKKLFNEKRVKTVYGDLKKVNEVKKHIKEKRSKKAAKSSVKKLPILNIESSDGFRRSKFHFMTTINKNKLPMTGNFNKFMPFKNNLKNALESMKNDNKEEKPLEINKNPIKKAITKRFSMMSYNFKSNLFRMDSKNLNEVNKESNKTIANIEDNFFDFYGDTNEVSKTPDIKKHKNKLTLDLFDKYITKTIKMNKKNINYNSGNFRIPLIF